MYVIVVNAVCVCRTLREVRSTHMLICEAAYRIHPPASSLERGGERRGEGEGRRGKRGGSMRECDMRGYSTRGYDVTND